MENLIDEEPLFKTKTGKDGMRTILKAIVEHHRVNSAGQRQLRISGRSSPFSETYSLCRWISSEYHCRVSDSCGASRGTRVTTSSVSWKRSMLLSTHMSKGVVVVPSSLYPRTWILS